MLDSNNVNLAAESLYLRLRQARETLGINRSELARRIGVQPSAAVQWEHENGTSPSTAHLIHIATLTHVSFDWLATGRGSARYQQETLAPEAVAMDLFEETLLKLARGIPTSARGPLLAFLTLLDKS
jgi:transcriptional regulator with XRE-family HTH domain